MVEFGAKEQKQIAGTHANVYHILRT
jgi:hypothetical protein